MGFLFLAVTRQSCSRQSRFEHNSIEDNLVYVEDNPVEDITLETITDRSCSKYLGRWIG